MTPAEARQWLDTTLWEERLNEREQRCLHLRAQGLLLREIGATFDRSNEWARQRLAEAGRKLRSPRTRLRNNDQGEEKGEEE